MSSIVLLLTFIVSSILRICRYFYSIRNRACGKPKEHEEMEKRKYISNVQIMVQYGGLIKENFINSCFIIWLSDTLSTFISI